ncbi:unnamed protein product [Bursaphelenchus okinawaensis]|uniref:RNA helicase n=1 Tax=Bursaphelenchus okinawaensis TaxID=465554 RepID=A0A811JUP4_9BILA|nr:unnamed protein product [Bursaphelenchus okinawaensis]CAG9084646.1 unnamed protein product [Bursaphelenchus okinawaensis]
MQRVYPPTVSNELSMATTVINNSSLIVVATAAMFTRLGPTIHQPVQGLLVDEADQLKASELLAAFCSLNSTVQRLVLAGDPAQLTSPLPPILLPMYNIGLMCALVLAVSHPQSTKLALTASFRFNRPLAEAISHSCYKSTPQF